MPHATASPFSLRIADRVLDDLRSRLAPSLPGDTLSFLPG
jgi:hypothetical protein